MRPIVAALAVAVLLLTGCAEAKPQAKPSATTESTPEAPPKADASVETAYVQVMAEALPSSVPDNAENRAALLSFGYSLCENAAAAGGTTATAADDHIATLDKADAQYLRDAGLALLAGKHAGEMLCPDYAG